MNSSDVSYMFIFSQITQTLLQIGTIHMHMLCLYEVAHPIITTQNVSIINLLSMSLLHFMSVI